EGLAGAVPERQSGGASGRPLLSNGTHPTRCPTNGARKAARAGAASEAGQKPDPAAIINKNSLEVLLHWPAPPPPVLVKGPPANEGGYSAAAARSVSRLHHRPCRGPAQSFILRYRIGLGWNQNAGLERQSKVESDILR